jgi:predicted ATPase with chaperone activity
MSFPKDTGKTKSTVAADRSSPERAQGEFEKPSHWPPAPRNLADLKIPHTLVTNLMLRHLRTRGVSTLTSLSESMKLSVAVIESLFEELRKLQLIHVKGMVGNDYAFELTSGGRNQASESSEFCHYAGPAPVSLGEYYQAIRTQAAKVKVNRARLRAALSDLVVSDRLLDQLGPALISQQSLFLYGPTGNGKTSYAERLVRVYGDTVVMPYTIEVDGQIVILHDPVVHRKTTIDTHGLDPRWVVCQRPCITVGGELVANLLDLQMDRASGTYLAPLQMKANNGMLIIDDLGRQTISPQELMNRWIVPLDRRVDYLTLSYGMKFEIPFELLVVFATNLEPADLADEAFLRRIPNKISVDTVNEKTFDEIFERAAAQHGFPSDPASAEYLRSLCLRRSGHELRACQPHDIFQILGWISQYEERPVQLNRLELDRAVALYFARMEAAAQRPPSPAADVAKTD